MIDVRDIDAFIRKELKSSYGRLGLTQRQKLCYEVMRLGIATSGRPPFEASMRAWQYGPVFPSLQRDSSGNSQMLSDYQRQLCRIVIARLAGFSADRLVARSHNFQEWLNAREGLRPTQQGDRPITIEAIRAVTFLQAKPDRVLQSGDVTVTVRWQAERQVWRCETTR